MATRTTAGLFASTQNRFGILATSLPVLQPAWETHAHVASHHDWI
jgi:hypothetical protein